MEINRLSALRTRAYENMVAAAICNYPDGQPDCNGHSTLFDGVPWCREVPGVRDMCVMEAPEKPGIYIATLDLDMLRAHRSNDVNGDKYRRQRYMAYWLMQMSGASLAESLFIDNTAGRQCLAVIAFDSPDQSSLISEHSCRISRLYHLRCYS